jgi:hypothetical protein
MRQLNFATVVDCEAVAFWESAMDSFTAFKENTPAPIQPTLMNSRLLTSLLFFFFIEVVIRTPLCHNI